MNSDGVHDLDHLINAHQGAVAGEAQTRAMLHDAIRVALATGERGAQADIARRSGYSRERLRQIAQSTAQTPATDGHWAHNPTAVLTFGQILVAAHWLDTPHDVLYYFEKPSKYDDLHTLWLNTDEPSPDDNNPFWETFLDQLDQK